MRRLLRGFLWRTVCRKSRHGTAAVDSCGCFRGFFFVGFEAGTFSSAGFFPLDTDFLFSSVCSSAASSPFATSSSAGFFPWTPISSSAQADLRSSRHLWLFLRLQPSWTSKRRGDWGSVPTGALVSNSGPVRSVGFHLGQRRGCGLLHCRAGAAHLLGGSESDEKTEIEEDCWRWQQLIFE
jgi:hypothetical protein